MFLRAFAASCLVLLCAAPLSAVPFSAIDVQPGAPIYVGDTVSVTGSGYTTNGNVLNSIAWTFSFGDGSPAITGSPATHVYSTPGNYYIWYAATFSETYYTYQFLYSYWVQTGPFGQGYTQYIYGWVPLNTQEFANGGTFISVLARPLQSVGVPDTSSSLALLGLSSLGLFALRRKLFWHS